MANLYPVVKTRGRNFLQWNWSHSGEEGFVLLTSSWSSRLVPGSNAHLLNFSFGKF